MRYPRRLGTSSGPTSADEYPERGSPCWHVAIDQPRHFGQQHLTGRVISPGDRELETELIEAVGPREVAKARSASPAVEGCEERGFETFRQELGV